MSLPGPFEVRRYGMAVYLEAEFGQWKLPVGETRLGRGRDCQIRLDDGRLSRSHACFIYGDGEVWVEDLGSTNGVLVNGDSIQGRFRLSHGQTVTIGPFSFRVRVAADEPDPSRIASEAIKAVAQAAKDVPAPERHPSEEFAPSTDRSSREEGRATVDMDPRRETPVARPLTDPVGQRGTSSALTERRSERRVAPVIESALEASDPTRRAATASDTPAPASAAVQRETDALEPSLQRPRRPKSNALMPIDESGRPLAEQEESWRLAPLSVAEAGSGALALASLGDLLLMLLAMLGWLALGAGGGYLLAQYWDQEAAESGILAQILAWHQDGAYPWWLWLGATTLGAGFAISHFVWSAAASSIRGGPWLHRRLGLAIIDDSSGHFPTPARCLSYWLLQLLTLPLAIACWALAWRSPSERCCRVHARLWLKA
ncbi:MAG: FHA domain-containing protein [Planctomycetota bacterium]|nr:MAG: FHA domain-containing protein [Planctomycetota bacterium]